MRLTRAVIIGIVLAAVAVGGYWYFRIRPRLRALNGEFDVPTASRTQTLKIRKNLDGDFDLTADLPGNPIGIAINGNELLIANRIEPWGFLRLQRKEVGSFEVQQLAVIEPDYGQKMSFDAVTWNGKEYVALTSESWFQKGEGSVFTVHDPESLAVRSHHPAPDHVGCIAWDGSSYWVGTRRNTEDSGEPAFVYRFNDNFQETGRFEPPDFGCQGLTWDGEHLWFADVFSDKIHVLKLDGEALRILQSRATPFRYLSGIGYDGRNIWVSEYDHNQIHRLIPALSRQWVSESETTASASEVEPAQPPVKTSDAYTNDFPDTGPEEMDVLELKAESRENAVFGSWKIHFGEDLFADNEAAEGSPISIPKFVRYTVYVEGGSLSKPAEFEHEATPGENSTQDEELASDLGPGEYSVHIFLHAQFVDSKGTNRILNDSSPSVTVTVE